MTKIRFYLIALLIWFFGFYNLERLIAPINISSFVYPLAAAYSLLMIVSPHVQRISLLLVSLAGVVLYLGLNSLFGHDFNAAGLPLIITEMASLVVTIYISSKLGKRIEGMRSEILRISVGPGSVAAKPFQTAQAECYREIRRARHYNRPAAILSIQPSKETVDVAIDKFLIEAQTSVARQYVVARTADLLRSALKETDVITMRDNHFLVLLPETTNDHLPIILQRLQKSALEKLGLELKVGVSSFPDDAITFESLVDYAEQRMNGSKEPNLPPAAIAKAPSVSAVSAQINNDDAPHNAPETEYEQVDTAG